MPPIAYPETRTVDATLELAGVAFSDPYVWLEEENDEVHRWQAEQAALATRTVRQWPHFDKVKHDVAKFSAARLLAAPRSAGGRWFRIDMPEGSSQAIARVSDGATGTSRILFDPASENPERPPFLSWISPSPDGRILALGVCDDGSENNTIRLIDVDSGMLLPNPPGQVLMDAWSGGAHWLADSSGFYFTALAGSLHDYQLRVFHHEMAAGAARQIDWEIDSGTTYPCAMTGTDGRWVVVLRGAAQAFPIAVLDREGDGSWRPFMTDPGGTVAGHIVGDHYVAVTDVGAPRGRVVAISLSSSMPDDPSSWEELVPESEAVIDGVHPVGDQLYVLDSVDTYARVRIFSRDGSPAGEVPLPGRGAIALLPAPGIDHSTPLINTTAREDEAGFIFGFSSLTASWGIYLHKPGQAQIEAVAAPELTLENAVIEDHWATSPDGTRIPYHVVRLASATPDQPRPALLFGYGGFNDPLPPHFPGASAAFVAGGGLFVHCHLRGGREFGRDWWHGGRMKNKQNCYLDLYAIAEDLIARGATRQGMLGVTGFSNGGLLAGVAAVQRPELWGVVLPRVPLLDIIGACREPYGRMAVAMDYGDPDDPDEVRRMALFSPCQMVREGVAYPAVYIDAGASDPRCPPWHGRKFAASLQAAQSGEAPILIHVWENVGHGFATAKDVKIEEHAEWLAFAMQQLGMEPS